MNIIQSAIAATLITVSMTTVVFAAEADKPVVPAGPVVAGQQPDADAAAKIKTDRLRERNKKAKTASGTLKKEVPAPASPAVKATAAKRAHKPLERKVRAGQHTQVKDSGPAKEALPDTSSAVK